MVVTREERGLGVQSEVGKGVKYMVTEGNDFR